MAYDVQAHRTDEILRNIFHWQMLDSLFIEYKHDIEWSLVLIDRLKRHRHLRHLCVVVKTASIKTSDWRLPKREMIDELVEAWANRDWISMFFIWHICYEERPRSNTISAIHHGDGHVKHNEFRDVPIDATVRAFPQFYTLFWQHLKEMLYPK